MLPATQLQQPSTAVSSYFPSDEDWKMLLDVGAKAFKSGLLPSAVKSPEAAAIIALKARELGLPIMVGFAHIYIVNGKPSMSAELIQATARKFLPGLDIKIRKTNNEEAVIDVKRPEPGENYVTFSFTMEDAKRAGLLSKDPWKQYPADMLFSRCITRALRKICPEALMGISYTPEELGANVNEMGEVIETTGKTLPGNDVTHIPPQQSNGSVKPFFQNSHFSALKAGATSKNLTEKVIFTHCQELFGFKDLRQLNQEQYEKLLRKIKGPEDIAAESTPVIEPTPASPEISPEFEKALRELDDPRMVK